MASVIIPVYLFLFLTSIVSFLSFVTFIFSVFHAYDEIDYEGYLKAKKMRTPENEKYFKSSKINYSDFYNIEYIYLKKNKLEERKLEEQKLKEEQKSLESIKKSVLK